MVIDHEQPMSFPFVALGRCRFRPLEKMAQCHHLVHLRYVFFTGRMQDHGLSIARYFEAPVVFFRDIAHFSQKRMDIAPFQIVRDRVLEDSVESSLMGASKWGGCFHIV
jgi:hypothetical protein